jgi:hypothetical protein
MLAPAEEALQGVRPRGDPGIVEAVEQRAAIAFGHADDVVDELAVGRAEAGAGSICLETAEYPFEALVRLVAVLRPFFVLWVRRDLVCDEA